MSILENENSLVHLKKGEHKLLCDKIKTITNTSYSIECICKSENNIILKLWARCESDYLSGDTKQETLIWYNEPSDTNIFKSTFISNSDVTEVGVLILSNNVETDVLIKSFKINSIENIDNTFLPFNVDEYIKKNVITWETLISNELLLDNNNGFQYPLIENTYEKQEIISMIKVLIGNRLTMGKNVDLFEKEFAKYVGSKYAIMVNSGSSANLLSMAVAVNYLRKNKLNDGDKILIPAVCWSTSVWPITQMNLIPVFVDVDPMTMNMDLDDMEKKLTKDVRGIVAVHILGNCTNMDRLMNLVKKHDLFLMEDTCESLGSKYKNKCLGTFGDFGTYSFYYSHHITTVEGGMIVCNDDEDYELLKCLRAHGWTRFLKDKDIHEQNNPTIDPRFLFVNVGYNLRPMETQAAMGRVQLENLNQKNNFRNINHTRIVSQIMNDPRNKDFLFSPKAMDDTFVAWFSICFILGNKYTKLYKEYLEYLTKNSIENRPVVTGNFVRQPAFKLMGLNYNIDEFPGAELLHFNGFFIGASCRELTENEIDDLIDIMLNYPR